MTKMLLYVRYRRLRLLAAMLFVSAGFGCATSPTLSELEALPPPHLQPNAPANIVDAQHRFESVFCASLSARGEEEGCERWLYASGGDQRQGAEVLNGSSPLSIVLVTGAFSECFGVNARPFGDALEVLRQEGHELEMLVVSGRSSAEHNAAQISEFMRSWPASHPTVMVGYSKGLTDILQFLASDPESAARVDAVVSVAGAAGGSPLADRFAAIYDAVFSHLPGNHCPPGDGGVMDSLRTDTRRQWWAEHTLPVHVRYYSLAVIATRDRIARALRPAWRFLAKIDPQNDGQLLATDALLPNSTLLAYLRSDHWQVALPLEGDFAFLTHRSDPAPFPHVELLRSILALISAEIR